jgi:hypothetical protein
MLVISAGMQKSGSGYLYNLVNDMIISTGGQDARSLKDQKALHDILQNYNNNMEHPSFRKLRKLWWFSRGRKRTFVVKTHTGPSRSLKWMLRLGLLKVLYSYRDPRDVLMSAQDHGQKILSQGENHTFARMVKFEDAFRSVKGWIRIWDMYRDLDGVLMVPYETLVEKPHKVAKEVADYLGLEITENTLREIVAKYDKSSLKEENKTGLHFNQGIAFRYRTEMPEAEKAVFTAELGAKLEEMGYSKQ